MCSQMAHKTGHYPEPFRFSELIENDWTTARPISACEELQWFPTKKDLKAKYLVVFHIDDLFASGSNTYRVCVHVA